MTLISAISYLALPSFRANLNILIRLFGFLLSIELSFEIESIKRRPGENVTLYRLYGVFGGN